MNKDKKDNEDNESLEHLAEMRSREAAASNADDVVFVMGSSTLHALFGPNAKLSSGAARQHGTDMADGTLLGCPLYVMPGSGTLCMRKDALIDLMQTLVEVANNEIGKITLAKIKKSTLEELNA